VAAIVFTSFIVQAYPMVGDKVQWKGSIKLKSGDITPVHIQKEVVKFDHSSKKWTIKYTATVGDKVTTEFLETADLYSPEKHKQMIATCKDQGGVIEKVTAPAGTYDTCKLTSKADGMVVEKWWGDIPFGVVSRNTTDSGEVGSDLNAIARGL
jgi:hypothetical protein